MSTPLERLGQALILGASLTCVACAATPAPQARRVSMIQAPIQPATISDDQFASAIYGLLADGNPTPQRTGILVGAVRRQFIRALERFDAGDDERGIAAVTGALYLVRAGELRPEMLDSNAEKAIAKALTVVAKGGDEGRSLALLRLRAAALPANSPEQEQIRWHLAALQTWLKDTRQRSEVENGSADQRAYGEASSLEPTPENIALARSSVERWVAAAAAYHARMRPGMERSERDQMIETYRALRTGAIVLAAIYLRHGDALAASKALQGGELQRAMPQEFGERLEAAASSGDPSAWRELAGLYASAETNTTNPEISIAPEIARGAAWGSLLEAYRVSPASIEAAVPLVDMLQNLGMPDATGPVLLPAIRETKNPKVIAGALMVVLKALVDEDQAHDPLSARRVFNASQSLLALADSSPQAASLEPSTARVRLVMGSIEVRAGEVVRGRPLLEAALAKEPSISGYLSLAAVLNQAGDRNGAQEAIGKALSAPDAASEPLSVAEAHLLAFQIHRLVGSSDLARSSLGAALRVTLETRAHAQLPPQKASVERLLARIAYFYGDTEAWKRALSRGFESALGQKNLIGMMAIEASSSALLRGDITAGRDSLRKAMTGGADDEDLVYAALWLALSQSPEKASADDTVKQALSSAKRNGTWTGNLAVWGLGKLDDAGLLSRARTVVQRTEASFYIAARKRSAGDPSAASDLEKIATGPAIELVETHLAREMTARTAANSFGAPPQPLP